MEFCQAEYFQVVSRLKNDTKAAEQLYVSQPSISVSIQKLEEELGIRPEILHRIVRCSSLGLSCLPHCGYIITLFALTGFNHKEAYKPIFWSALIISSICMILAVVMGSKMYPVTGIKIVYKKTSIKQLAQVLRKSAEDSAAALFWRLCHSMEMY